jgi:hypothetical protein
MVNAALAASFDVSIDGSCGYKLVGRMTILASAAITSFCIAAAASFRESVRGSLGREAWGQTSLL